MSQCTRLTDRETDGRTDGQLSRDLTALQTDGRISVIRKGGNSYSFVVCG